MNDTPMTREQAETLAAHVHGLRPDWDPQGIMAQLAKVRHMPLDQIEAACQRATENHMRRTPVEIGDPSSLAWLTPVKVQSKRNPHRDEACETCGKTRVDCERTEARMPAELAHQFRPVGQEVTERVTAATPRVQVLKRAMHARPDTQVEAASA